jgi:hypothetical protein
VRKRRITVVWLLLGVAGLLWAAAGFQTVHPEDEVVIVASSFGGARILAGPWGWVPAGWSRVVRVPRMTRTIDLPGAEAARIPARDGSLFGYEGSVTVSPAAGGEDRLVRAVATGSRSLAEIVDDAVRDAGGSVEARASRRRVYVPTLQREFRRRLLASLEERGLRLDALDVRRRVSLFDPEPDRRRIANSRLLVVGLDGADWSVLDPLLDKGRLPHLRRLIDDGVRAKLQSISPMISPVVWTTMGTGVPPERHGVLDFLVPAGRAGEGEPVTSAERLVPAVWNILSDRGVTTGVVGWWATWPAESLNGYLVTDRVAYQLFGFRPDRSQGEGKTWPPDLYAAIEEKVVEPSSVGWDEVLPYLAGPRTRPEQFDST